jgi:Mg-chelatase subunit ChlI
VRTEIVDRGLPLAVVVTPQSFLPAVNRFVKKTGYAMEQFFGRNYRAVQLPSELEEADMVAVARIHFPEMGDDYLALIADLARLSENYLQAVEAIAKLARYIARREKHRRITVDDIQAAASEVIPHRSAPVAPREPADPIAGTRRQTNRSGIRRSVSRPVNDPLTTPSRELKPACEAGDSDVVFDSRSLRGAGPGMEKTEVVSADS